LAAYARAHRHLPAGWRELDGVPLAKVVPARISIFTPGEMRRLLDATPPSMIPFMTIAAFAGVRHFEILRMDWSEVGTDLITIPATKAKGASRRLIPIADNLRTWLAPFRRPRGPVCAWKHAHNALTRISRKARVTWHQNALRHSFISYRLAVAQDAARIALEAGNSPAMIFRNYRELVTPEQGKAWFFIVPVKVNLVTNRLQKKRTLHKPLVINGRK
jgi:integrase